MPEAPLDYILALPKIVYKKLLEKTREKMLYGRQDLLMDKLKERRAEHKKWYGAEMDDI